MCEIILHRVYHQQATHGLLQVNGHNVCLTIELPWVSNQRFISCIPEGQYPLKNRFSHRFKAHIEVCDVPDRSLILFHPANNAQLELKGCIAPVNQILNTGWGSRSKIAMSRLLFLVRDQLPIGTVRLKVQKATNESIIQIIKKGEL